VGEALVGEAPEGEAVMDEDHPGGEEEGDTTWGR
jgi:hypothetical protein